MTGTAGVPLEDEDLLPPIPDMSVMLHSVAPHHGHVDIAVFGYVNGATILVDPEIDDDCYDAILEMIAS